MRVIVNAAIKYPDGEIVLGKSHTKIVALQAKLGVRTSDEQIIKGFVDSADNFLTREEALSVAIKSGQIKKSKDKKLFSDDLWPTKLVESE